MVAIPRRVLISWKPPIAWFGAFFAALAASFVAKFPVTWQDWITTLTVCAAAGFAGIGAKAANKSIDDRAGSG